METNLFPGNVPGDNTIMPNFALLYFMFGIQYLITMHKSTWRSNYANNGCESNLKASTERIIAPARRTTVGGQDKLFLNRPTSFSHRFNIDFAARILGLAVEMIRADVFGMLDILLSHEATQPVGGEWGQGWIAWSCIMLAHNCRHESDRFWKKWIEQRFRGAQRQVSLLPGPNEPYRSVFIRLLRREKKQFDRSKKTVAYWNEAFSKENQTEWLAPYEAFRHLLLPILGDSDRVRILIVGCGLSHVAARLYADGYKHITSTDISGARLLVNARISICLSFKLVLRRSCSFHDA